MIDFKVKSNLSGASSKVKKISSNKSLGLFLANMAADGMNQYVPMDTGSLAGSAVASPFKITYSAPYAVYVYNGQGKNFSKERHPKATAEWNNAYKIAKGKELGKAGTDFLKGM